MRIYSEPLPEPEYAQDLLDDPAGGPLLKQYLQTISECNLSINHKFKYRLMWELRSLENEIDAENGMLVIKANGVIEPKDFSEEIKTKIGEVLKTINWKIW